MKKGAFTVFALLLFTGCGVVKKGTIPWEENTPTVSSATDSNSNSDSKENAIENESGTFVETSEPVAVQERQQFLELAYNDWKGTPYLLGGAGYEGIDCSAFMQVVFEDYFSTPIPRTTLEQLKAGKEVSKSESKAGDLIFFKTGRRTYHVGVMINRDEFLHASTSKGVTISALDYPYWQETYLATKRIL